MFQNLIIEDISNTLIQAFKKDKIITPEDTSLLFYDLTFLQKRIEDLKKTFPANTLHAIAIKANPLISILKFINQFDVGVEAASLPELEIAVHSGFSPNKIVFDSPVKTNDEIETSLKLGVHINADSLIEFKRISELLRKTKSKSTIGIRINPQVGTGAIASTSVAGEYSKFGVPIKEKREELIETFLKFDWLTGVHLHIGSQGCEIDLLQKGIGIVFDFVKEVNKKLELKKSKKRINTFDIGGGLPVSYYSDKKSSSMREYKDLIFSKYPELFSSNYKLITEFGRYIFANTGWAVSRVEYIKSTAETNTIMIHLGADMYLRKAYNPESWHHEISVLDKFGKIKTNKVKKLYNIAGPLCFSGDFVAKKVILPEVEEGDLIVIQDSGAYTFSMWSRYNSRQMPKVIGYFKNGKLFQIIKERESVQNLINFWS